MGVLQVSNEDILVFGGFDNGQKEEVYLYQVNGKSVKNANSGQMVHSDGEFR